MRQRSRDAQVIIVGAGPVGMALAADLGTRGVNCLVLERTDGRIEQPRMDLVGVRTMEFCRRWGIADWVRACPFPRDMGQDFVYCTSVTGHELARQKMPALADARPAAWSPETSERCPQNMFDPILRRFCESLAEIEIAFETDVLEVTQNEDEACVRTADGRLLTADYVVGCDGVGSTVRKSLGIAMEGNAVLTHSINLLLKIPDLDAHHDKYPCYRFLLVGEEGIWATMVRIDGHDTYRLQIVGDTQPQADLAGAMERWIHRAVGRDVAHEVLSVVPWTRRELVARHYGRGRVWLAGDSVHAMSPTGGFGMNTGIGDAIDLSWKLAGALAGWGGPGLVASYEAERRPVGLRAVRQAARNIARMRAYRPEPDLLEEGPKGKASRRASGKTVSETMAREWFSPGIHIGYRYEGSPLCLDDGTPEPPDAVNSYEQTARPGGRAPHVDLGNGRSTLDLFGPAFVLLQVGNGTPQPHAIVDAFRHRGCPIDVVRLTEPEVASAYRASLVLVRPDGHVAWRGDAVPDDADRLAAIVTGAGSTSSAIQADVPPAMRLG